MLSPGFLGPAYRSRSKTLADQECINLYPEIVETKTGKTIGAFYTTPGLDLLATIGNGPIRGLHVSAGILYVVSGNGVYSVDTNYNSTFLGMLTTSSGPVKMIDNGSQTLIIDGNVLQSVLSDFTINNAGSGGYDGTYALPLPVPSSGGQQAVGNFTITDGAITDAEIIYGGAGYSAGFTLSNTQLAGVVGVGPLVNASISFDVGGGVAHVIGKSYSIESLIPNNPGGSFGNSYVPGDQIFLTGGVYTQVVEATVVTTQVTSSSLASPTQGPDSVSAYQVQTPINYDGLVHATEIPASGGTGTGASFSVLTSASRRIIVNLYNGGSGYTVNDVLTVPGSSVAAGFPNLSILVTQLNGFSVKNPGSGGLPGPVVLTGTTGTGSKFMVNGYIAISGELSIVQSLVYGGNYTVNPTDLTAEPVTGGGLVGAEIDIVMGVSTVSVSNPGNYLTNQTATLTQQSTSGVGVGATFTPTYQLENNFSLSPVPLPFPGASTACYQDGFGLINQLGTNTFWQSNVLDLTTWDPLNFSEADATPDNVVALAEVQREVWVIKERYSEIWINAGLSGFAFQRLDGVFAEKGCLAPYSVARAGNSLIWLSQSSQGQNEIVMTRGYDLEIISTHGLQYLIDQYPTTSDAFAYTYQQEKHTFYVITFPSGNETWVYDVSASEMLKIPCWHKRAAFFEGAFNRHQGSCHVSFNNQVVIGDYQTGNIYAFDLNAYTDNGAQRKWVRSWRALPQPQYTPQTFASLQIDMQVGVGVPDGTNPQVVLKWSDNDGFNWSDQRIKSAGQTGQTSLRVKFNRLGSTKYNAGLDRIFKLESSDIFGVALLGANIEQ